MATELKQETLLKLIEKTATPAFVGVYLKRLDGDFDLLAVITAHAEEYLSSMENKSLSEHVREIFAFAREEILTIGSNQNDFPDVWERKNG